MLEFLKRLLCSDDPVLPKGEFKIPDPPREPGRRVPPNMCDYRMLGEAYVRDSIKRGLLTWDEVVWQQATIFERFNAWKAGKPYYVDYAAYKRGEVTQSHA